MPFSLLANPTLAMLIELVPLAFVTMSIVAIAATAAASNRFNESPRIGCCGCVRGTYPRTLPWIRGLYRQSPLLALCAGR
jgi:hypothetical protein